VIAVTIHNQAFRIALDDRLDLGESPVRQAFQLHERLR
jgi:hypothetical protein